MNQETASAARTPRSWQVVAAIAVLVLFAVGAAMFADAPDEAEAHAALISSNPGNGEQVARPPLRVILNFSEPLERQLTTIEVMDVDGNRVDDDDVQFDDNDRAFASIGVPDITPGLYTASFNNVSTVDGHPWKGVTQFIVLNPDGSVPANAVFDPDAAAAGGGTGLLPRNVDIIAKWIALIAATITAGAAFWVLAIGRPAANFLEEEEYLAAIDHAERTLVHIAHVLLPVGFIAMGVLVVLTVGRFETSTSLAEYLTSIQTGRYRVLFAMSMVVVLIGIDILYLARNSRLRNVGLVIAIGGSLVGLLTFSLTSHSGTGPGSFWAVSSDYIHLLASGVWLGMLVMLVPLLVWSRRALTDETRFLYAANVLDRFSALAGLSVIAVFATGSFNGLAQLPSWSAWVETTYGRVLLAKMLIVLPLLAVAGVNAFVLKPRIVNAIDGMYQKGGTPSESERDSANTMLARLQRVLPVTVAVEMVLVIAVFASVAVLTQTSTAEGELTANAAGETSGFKDEKTAGDLQLDFTIEPNEVGLNKYTLVIRDEAGAPLEDASRVRLRFYYDDPEDPGNEAGQSELVLDNFGAGEYSGGGAFFAQPGTWRVEAGVRREGEDDIFRNFVSAVAPLEDEQTLQGGRFAMPFTALTWNEVLGAAVVLAGAIILLYGRPISNGLSLGKRWIASAALMSVVAGGVLMYAVEGGAESGALAKRNPIKPDEQSILRGEMMFQQNCIVCHGVNGRGDGPQAASLNPKPTDFRLHLPLHTDPQFWAFIAGGVPGSAMPAWRDELSEDDIWNLVNFLRASFSGAPTE